MKAILSITVAVVFVVVIGGIVQGIGNAISGPPQDVKATYRVTSQSCWFIYVLNDGRGQDEDGDPQVNNCGDDHGSFDRLHTGGFDVSLQPHGYDDNFAHYHVEKGPATITLQCGGKTITWTDTGNDAPSWNAHHCD